MNKALPKTKPFDVTVQRSFWNQWIADCLETDRLDSSSLRRGETVLQLARSLDLSNPAILEIGCATGWLSAQLARFGTVTGLDLADKPIAAAKIKYPNIEFIAGDFLNLDLPAEHFDLVVSVDVISVVQDQAAFLDKIRALLKPSGYLIVMCPNKFVWDRTEFTRRSKGEIPLNWLNMKDLEALLRSQFGLKHKETILPAGNRGILRLVNSYKLNRLMSRIIYQGRLDKIKEKIGLGKSLVVVVQKKR